MTSLSLSELATTWLPCPLSSDDTRAAMTSWLAVADISQTIWQPPCLPPSSHSGASGTPPPQTLSITYVTFQNFILVRCSSLPTSLPASRLGTSGFSVFPETTPDFSCCLRTLYPPARHGSLDVTHPGPEFSLLNLYHSPKSEFRMPPGHSPFNI